MLIQQINVVNIHHVQLRSEESSPPVCLSYSTLCLTYSNFTLVLFSLFLLLSQLTRFPDVVQ